MKTKTKWLAQAALGLAAMLGLAGCPSTGDQAAYDAGYVVGFADDELYWSGFDDSYDTVDGGAIYYAGSDIPYLDELSYDAGFYDGEWYAYNDGYFVDYDYAFTIGFSEGYDAAFAPDAIAFIQNDQHAEWLDGGFTDGYDDGFSEGRVFGAYDYLNDLPFDWFDAMEDYRGGTDLTVGGVSTGDAGPVQLYVYGTDPNDLVKKADARALKRIAAGYTIRHGAAKQANDEISYRPFITAVQSELNVKPTTSGRGGKVSLTTTWLQRVTEYRNAVNAEAKIHRGK